MIIGVHQPNYLPYLGFFDKMNRCDIFVIYDSAQYNKDNFQHRNRIRIYNGWKWLTVPVEKRHISINEVKIKNININHINWQQYHLNEIHDNYRKTPYYASYEDEFKTIYKSKYNKLTDLNMDLICLLRNLFDVDTEIVYSSELKIKSRSTQALVDMVRKLGGDVYLSGPSGRTYLDISLFDDIKVEFQEFNHPVYTQCYDGFIPNLSAIDALFNVGEIPK